jgi:ankyrin repeat protein
LFNYWTFDFFHRPLEFLSSRGASLEEVDKEGTTPLMIACMLGRIQVTELRLLSQELTQ